MSFRRIRLLLNKRAEFTKATKAQAFLRADGKCENCGVKLRAGGVFYDHVVAASIGGGNDLGNAACLCKTCHSEKTNKLDIPRAAKTERLRQKHVAGIR